MTGAAKPRSPLSAVLMIAAAPLLFHLVILATRTVPFGLSAIGLVKLSFITVSAVMHWGLYASLLATFALTLRHDRTPLITAMAYRLHGTLTEEMIRYTRWVTIAWSAFFATQLTTSISLFCFAPLAAWSFFVNVLDIPLVAAMFAAEYAVRIRVLVDPPRHSLSMIVRMVSQCMHEASPAAAPPSELPRT
jgi:uncharacterized membrane protein